MTNQFYVYILANAHNTTLYIGITNNLERRVYEHKTHFNKGFTYKYNVEKLVWYDVFPTAKSAILREKQLKKWNREWKERIINEMNPVWKDLSEGWYDDRGDSRLRGNDYPLNAKELPGRMDNNNILPENVEEDEKKGGDNE